MEEPLHLHVDDDLFEEHSPSCRCSLCHPELLHQPDLHLIVIISSGDSWIIEP